MIIYNRTTSSDRDSIINYVKAHSNYFFFPFFVAYKMANRNKTAPYHQQQRLCGSSRSLLEHQMPDPSLMLQAPDHKMLGNC